MKALFAAFFEEETEHFDTAELRLIGVYTTIELFQKACEIHFETIRKNYKEEKLNWSPISRTIHEITHKNQSLSNNRYFARLYILDKLPNYSMHTN